MVSEIAVCFYYYGELWALFLVFLCFFYGNVYLKKFIHDHSWICEAYQTFSPSGLLFQNMALLLL